MPISIKCPKCGQGHQVRDELAGKRVKCSCGQAIQVPAAAPASLLDDLLPPLAPPPAAVSRTAGRPLPSSGRSMGGKSKKSGMGSGALAAIIGGGVVAVGIVIGLIVWAVSAGSTAAPNVAGNVAPSSLPATANPPTTAQAATGSVAPSSAPGIASSPTTAPTAAASGLTAYGHVNEFAICADGTRLVTKTNNTNKTPFENTFKIWNLGTGQELASFVTMGRYDSLALSPDNTLLAVNGLSEDLKQSLLYILELPSGNQRFKLEIPPNIAGFAFSGDGTSIACWNTQNLLSVDAKTGEHKKHDPPPPGYFVHQAYSPHGSLFATGRLVKALVAEGKSESYAELEVCRFGTAEILKSTRVANSVTAVAFSPDGGTLVVGIIDGQILVWDTTKWEPSAVLVRPADAVPMSQYAKIVVSSGGGWIAATVALKQSGRPPIEVWDMRSKQSRRIEGFSDFAFAPTGILLVKGWEPPFALSFVDPATGKQVTSPATTNK